MSSNKKFILVLGTDLFGPETISHIVGTSLNFLNSNDYIFCGFSKNNQKRIVNDNVVSYSIKNPLDSFHPFLRMKRKILRIFKRDDSRLLEMFLVRKFKVLFNFNNIKEIIAVSGNFVFMHAAYRLAKNNGIDLKLVYFDPFSNSPFISNRGIRASYEKEWCSYAKKIYRDYSSNIQIECADSSKVHDFKIPISVCQNETLDGSNIIYGGLFYKTFRKPDQIIKLASTYPSQRFFVYSNFMTTSKYDNLKFLPLLSKEEYEKILKTSKAVIVIGNGSYNSSMPSKFLEAIAYKKTIIGIDINCDELKKYPFYFDYKDPCLIEKIDNIKMIDKKEYNIFENYPDRNPFYFAKIFE